MGPTSFTFSITSRATSANFPASDDEIQSHAINNGMRTMWQNGIHKITAGITTPEEVIREVPFKF